MNLLKIQDALKNASDDQLMQLMQSPDSSAPSYLVLSEIRRRKDMRAQQPQEPQGTVAEDLASVPQTYDQAGIRSLRTPGYEEEERASPDDMQEMREGGIVRMQPGGQVYGGGDPLDPYEALRRRTDPNADLFRELGLAPPPVSERPLTGRSIPLPEPTLSPFGEAPPNPTERAQLPPENPPAPLSFGQSIPNVDFGPVSAPGSEFVRPQTQAAGAPAAGAATGAAGANANSGRAAAGIRGAGVGGGGFEDGVLGGMRRLEAAFPNNLAALREELEKGRTNPQERRREAQNLALMEAGLRMAASKNPSFLGSIGEGATPAVQSYGQQLGQIRQDERQDIRDRFSLEQANLQRMYALGQISAAEYRSRVAEAGANARAAAANETQRQISERQVTALESRERTAAANAEATTQRAMDAQLAQALRNPELRQQARMSLQADRAARGDRTPVTDAEINNAIVAYGIRPGMSSPQPQGSIVVRDGVQHYVR
jgi:hypothetical protein